MNLKSSMLSERSQSQKVMKVKVKSCPTLWDPMDCNLLASSIYGIFQARILEQVAISFSRSSQPSDWTQVSCIVLFSSVQSLSRVRLCDHMICSMPGLPIHHHLLEFTQTHVHRFGDAIQPCSLHAIKLPLKIWCFWTVLLEKTWESLGLKEIQPVHPKGDQS